VPAGYHLTTLGRPMRPPLGRPQSVPKARRLSGVRSGIGSGVTTPRGDNPRFARSNRNSGRTSPRGGPTTPRGHPLAAKTCAPSATRFVWARCSLARCSVDVRMLMMGFTPTNVAGLLTTRLTPQRSKSGSTRRKKWWRFLRTPCPLLQPSHHPTRHPSRRIFRPILRPPLPTSPTLVKPLTLRDETLTRTSQLPPCPFQPARGPHRQAGRRSHQIPMSVRAHPLMCALLRLTRQWPRR
jgi:hypothetical protein